MAHVKHAFGTLVAPRFEDAMSGYLAWNLVPTSDDVVQANSQLVKGYSIIHATRSTTVNGVFFPARVDLTVDLGDPFLNRVVNGFLKIGTVAVAKVAVEETYHVVNKGSVSKHNFEHSLKAMCKEGAYWGSVAGVYVGMEYGVERVRGIKDWKNAMVGGALTGAIVSAASNNNRDKIVLDAITGGAIATAAEFLSYLT